MHTRICSRHHDCSVHPLTPGTGTAVRVSPFSQSLRVSASLYHGLLLGANRAGSPGPV